MTLRTTTKFVSAGMLFGTISLAFLTSQASAQVAVQTRERIAADYAKAVEMFHSSRALDSGPMLDAVVSGTEALPDSLRPQDREILAHTLALRAQLRLDLDQQADATADLVWLIQLDKAFQFDAASVSPKILELERQARSALTGRVRMPTRPGSKAWIDRKRLDGVSTVLAQPGSRHVAMDVDGVHTEGDIDVRGGRETEVATPPRPQEPPTFVPTASRHGGEPTGTLKYSVNHPRILTVRVGVAIDYGADSASDSEGPITVKTRLTESTYTWQSPAGAGTEVGATVRVPGTPFSFGATRLTTSTNFRAAFQTTTAQGNTANLHRSQEALHLEIGVSLGGDKLECAVFAGPSFLQAKQELLTTVNSAARTYSTQEIETGRGKGFNIGLDGAWMFAKYVGVGVGLRYSRAFADVVLLGDTVPLQLGGYQMGLGARFRF